MPVVTKQVVGSFGVYSGYTDGEWLVVASDSAAEEMPTLAVFIGDNAERKARELATALGEALNEDVL